MCVVRGMHAGWGEPCFDKVEALLAHAMLSIPATKGFEIGVCNARLRGDVSCFIEGFGNRFEIGVCNTRL